MATYIDAKGQLKMVELIKEFHTISEGGTDPNHKSDRIMSLLYSKYIDKIIAGTIRTYKFYQFGDVDELSNVAREYVYKAILKNSWDPARGASIFSFFTTVISRNLYNYTKSESKKSSRMVYMDYDSINVTAEEKNLLYHEDQDYAMVFEYVFEEIINFFQDSGKPRFKKLSHLFKQFFYTHIGEKFRKKDFIEYAKSEGFSPSTCNLFFETLKKNKNLRELYKELARTNFGKEL